jgi:hypothetical protein
LAHDVIFGVEDGMLDSGYLRETWREHQRGDRRSFRPSLGGADISQVTAGILARIAPIAGRPAG